MQISFNITDWFAASARMHTEEQWRQWARGELSADTLPESKPDVSFLPAMQRRRLGTSARLLFQAAHTLVGEKHLPLVLASHDGEINRSFELWQSLLRENSVSPTSFGLSVHNALAGQWSMLRGDMSENTALSVCEDGFEIAVTEAAAMLSDGVEQVLVVAADEPLSADYRAKNICRAPFAYALALLLERGRDWQLCRQPENAQAADCGYWGGLQWVKHRLSGSQSWTQHYQGRAWQWSHNA